LPIYDRTAGLSLHIFVGLLLTQGVSKHAAILEKNIFFYNIVLLNVSGVILLICVSFSCLTPRLITPFGKDISVNTMIALPI
jgi:hypothetical protein